MSADDGEWQKVPDWILYDGKPPEEIPLPPEVWEMILLTRPVDWNTLRTLSYCSKELKALVEGASAIRLRTPREETVWPGPFLRSFTSVRSLRFNSKHRYHAAPKQYSDALDEVTRISQLPEFADLFQVPLALTEGTLQGMFDEEEGGERIIGVNVGVADVEDTDEDDDFDVDDDDSDDDSSDEGQTPTTPRTIDTTMVELSINNGGVYGEFYRDSVLWKETLSLEYEERCLQYQTLVSAALEPLGLPPTLTELEMPYAIPPHCLPRALRIARLPGTNFATNLALLPRSLVHLQLHQVPSLEGCPPGLTKLTISSSREGPRDWTSYLEWLPPTLKAFTVMAPLFFKTLPLLPRNLDRLHLGFVYCPESYHRRENAELQDGALFYLPRNLKHFRLDWSHALSAQCLRYLPSSLVCLGLPSDLGLTDKDLQLLPPSLTKFRWQGTGVTHQAYDLLPAGVKRNPDFLPQLFHPAHALRLMKMYPSDFLEWEWPPYFSHHLPVEACPYLPRTMRSLVVDGLGWNAIQLANLPPLLEKLHLRKCEFLSAECASNLPKTLIELSMPLAVFDALTLKHLPDSISTLYAPAAFPQYPAQPGVLPQDFIGGFPSSLTTLFINGVFTLESVALLPKTLLDLELIWSDMQDAWIPSLPPALTRLCMPRAVSITDAGVCELPRSLVVLQLEGENKITDTGGMLFPPHLRVLQCPNNMLLTDVVVPFLSRHLVQIDLRNNHNFTYLSIGDWPHTIIDFAVPLKEPPPPPKPAQEPSASCSPGKVAVELLQAELAATELASDDE